MQKKNSNSDTKCQGIIGVYSGLADGKIFSGPLRCNKWSCPFCKRKKLAQLRKRLLNGELATQSVSKYGLKFATLTFGGNEARSKYIVKNSVTGKPSMVWEKNLEGKWSVHPVYDSTAMYEKMSLAFSKMIVALKARYGFFRYFRIYEPHKDGVPHIHVLFAGNNIIPKTFLSSITKLWKKYDLGFVKLNTIRDRTGRVVMRFNDVQHAINYLLKYLTKGVKTAGKYKRVFSCSQKSLMPIQKKDWEIMQLIMGRFDDKGNVIEEVIADFNAIEEANTKVCFDGDFSLKKPDIVEMIMDRHIKHLTQRECSK